MTRAGADDIRIGDGGGIDADFVRARFEQFFEIRRAAHAAADRERHKHFARHGENDIEHRRPPGGRGVDIEQRNLVGALRIVGARAFDGIAGVAQVHKIDSLDDAPARDIEAGDDSFGDSHCGAAAIRSRADTSPKSSKTPSAL